MSLQTRLSDISTRLGTEFKAIRTLLNGNAANLNALTTTTKTNLVAAINEVKAEVAAAAASGGAAINDASASTTQVYSSSKTENLVSTSVAALIDDAATSSTKVYSSSKTADLVTASISAVLDGAPAALDTLNELAAAIGDNASYAASVTTALGQRVAVTAQTFTAPEKAQALTNIGAIAASAIGDPETDLVAVFEAALT
jgi:hypothetical protein